MSKNGVFPRTSIQPRDCDFVTRHDARRALIFRTHPLIYPSTHYTLVHIAPTPGTRPNIRTLLDVRDKRYYEFIASIPERCIYVKVVHIARRMANSTIEDAARRASTGMLIKQDRGCGEYKRQETRAGVGIHT